MNKLSVVLATFNEEKNIGDCLDSIKDIASEIIIVDGRSSDKTVEIVRKYGGKILVTDNHPIFHINKQKALDLATGEWILQLDADERITPALAKEIIAVIKMFPEELEKYQLHLKKRQLFLRHQQLLERRDGQIGAKTGEYVAFFLPRLNFFLGGFLRYGGAYPDGAIRLVKKNKAEFPCKNVHEIMTIKGRVGWLEHDLIHIDSPTFKRYLQRNNRYINLIVTELKDQNLPKDVTNFIDYLLIKPIGWFLLTTLRHKGFLDGYRGIIFSFFSALRFPRAYLRYLTQK